MKQSAIILSLIGIAASMNVDSRIPANNREIKRNRFGHMETVEWSNGGMAKTIFANSKPFAQDYERQTRTL